MATLNLDRSRFEDLLKKRLFVIPSFAVYNGVKGLYDYGPLGCAMKTALLSLWRRHFVLEESLLEIETTCLTPSVVLEASGHVDRFTDLMVRDLMTKECYRADHRLKEVLDELLAKTPADPNQSVIQADRNRIDDLTMAQLSAMFRQYQVKSPAGNELSEPFPFNLMFATSIGPVGNQPAYLRPEIAQGMFVNFNTLLQANGSRLPLGIAQIGTAFRNEIAPRSGLLRVREFTLAEIEYFVHPQRKVHPKFTTIAQTQLPLVSRDRQNQNLDVVLMTAQQAVHQRVIAHELLAYFLVRTYQFLRLLGLPASSIRFRQHLGNEMAHYANDCWDAEILTSYGWVECVGHADRGDYDLSQHARRSGTSMEVFEPLAEPITETVYEVKMNKSKLGQTYRSQAKAIITALEQLDPATCQHLYQTKPTTWSLPTMPEVQLTAEMVTIEAVEKRVTGRRFIPHVIEPSFGVGRILYSLLENTYAVRPNDSERTYFRLPARIAPITCCLLPLSNHESLIPMVQLVQQLLIMNGITNKLDDAGTSIGRRYARNDEIGIPYAVTIDFTTIEDQTVTLRDRDSMEQVRIPISSLANELKAVKEGQSWEQLSRNYPKQTSPAEE
jgi:glycyl-tRNA synthetase